MTAGENEQTVLHAACAQASLDGAGATLLHRHATSVWLLPRPGIVARISHSPDAPVRAERTVTLTRWLTDQRFPATRPAVVDQPVQTAATSITFWQYYPQPDGPGPDAPELGTLLQRLHQLATPPVPLPDYLPLTHLGSALDLGQAGHQGGAELSSEDLAWLACRRRQLLDAYGDVRSELGVGFIHGDAYPGNTLWTGENSDQVVLGDWDEAARGPRELDLINTHQGARMGRSPQERQAFTDAYGWDVTAWPSYPLLREIRDLHTLASYLGRAVQGDQAAASELQYRVRTLRAGDTRARWQVC